MASNFNVYKWRRDQLNEGHRNATVEKFIKQFKETFPHDRDIDKEDLRMFIKDFYTGYTGDTPSLNEDDGLPAGAGSNPNAPWNQRDRGSSVRGKSPSKNNVVPVAEYSGQYLFFDKNTNHYIFTLNDAFSDIFDLLDDYLDKEPGTSSDEWRDYVSNKDVLRALARYINDGKADLAINRDEYEEGDYDFLLVTKENFDEVRSFLPNRFIQVIQQADNLQ